MDTNTTCIKGGNKFAVLAVLIGTVFTFSAVDATVITFENTSSSFIQIRDESAGNIIVTNITTREGTYVVDLTNGNNFRLRVGQPGDQGSHYFQVIGGQIVFPGGNPATKFFTNHTATSLTIGSIPVQMRLLSGPASTVVSGGGDSYFAPFSLSAGGTQIVNLTPSDGFFVGNWKNIFPYGFVQQTPMQLGPNGILSMTNPGGTNNPGHTTIVPGSLVQTNFFEASLLYTGYRFTVDRADSSQLGDGSEWLFFTQAPIPEPSVAALWVVGAAALRYGRQRRQTAGR